MKTKFKFFIFETDKFPTGDDYKYVLENDCYEFEHEKNYYLSPEQATADYYFNNCDGWEDRWPINFCLLTVGNKEINRFRAHQEMAFGIEGM